MAGPSRTFSLRAHLLLLVIGTLVPALLIAAVLVRRVFEDNRKAVEQRLLETARAAAAVVDAELGGTIRALQGLGESGRLTEGEIPGFYDQAQRLLKTQPTWSAVSLSTPDGQQIVNTNRHSANHCRRSPIATASSGRSRPEVPVIGNLQRGQITQQLGFIVRVPILREDRVSYVLTAWITSDRVRGRAEASGTAVRRMGPRRRRRHRGDRRPVARS